MKYLALQNKIKTNIFTFVDVIKHFSDEDERNTRVQLGRFVKKGLIIRIKRGLYCFDPKRIDELELASWLYQPSYISLETALNYYGLIPDIPQTVTSVCLTTTKRIHNQFGSFSYTKIKPSLFFGFVKVKSAGSDSFFNLAEKEKALLDYFYLRKIKTIADLRLNLKDIDNKRYRQYARSYSKWVRKIL